MLADVSGITMNADRIQAATKMERSELAFADAVQPAPIATKSVTSISERIESRIRIA